jgi:hypothetical protein
MGPGAVTPAVKTLGTLYNIGVGSNKTMKRTMRARTGGHWQLLLAVVALCLRRVSSFSPVPIALRTNGRCCAGLRAQVDIYIYIYTYIYVWVWVCVYVL